VWCGYRPQRTAAAEERAKAAESQSRGALTAAVTEARKSAVDREAVAASEEPEVVSVGKMSTALWRKPSGRRERIHVHPGLGDAQFNRPNLAFGQCDAFRRSAIASPGGVFNHTVVVVENPSR
jgi:hypothetical protein